jgi:GT2 family glycosyltransferase
VRLLILSDSRQPSELLTTRKGSFPSASVIVLSSKGGTFSYAPGTMTLPMRWSHKQFGQEYWQHRHRLRRVASEIFGFKAAKHFGWEEDIVSEVAACDPDLIDLREVRNSHDWLAEVLRQQFPERRIITSSDTSCLHADSSAWRRYDPLALVSIILPVYNGERFLRQSLESCLSQNHHALELIAVDDCSTDESPKILMEYAERDKRLRIVRNTSNKGLPESLNVGFREAVGQYLTWTSDDNIYSPGAIAYMVQQLSTYPEVGFVYTSFIRIDDDGKELGVVLCSPPTGLRRLDLASGAVGACFMYRSEVREAVGSYRSEYRNAEDFDYWVRICLRYPSRHYYEPYYFYRMHAASLTSQHRVKWKELNTRILNEHFPRGGPEIIWHRRGDAAPSEGE